MKVRKSNRLNCHECGSTNKDSKNAEKGNQLLHAPTVKHSANLSDLVTVGCQHIQGEKGESRAKREDNVGGYVQNSSWNRELGRRSWKDG